MTLADTPAVTKTRQNKIKNKVTQPWYSDIQITPKKQLKKQPRKQKIHHKKLVIYTFKREKKKKPKKTPISSLHTIYNLLPKATSRRDTAITVVPISHLQSNLHLQPPEKARASAELAVEGLRSSVSVEASLPLKLHLAPVLRKTSQEILLRKICNVNHPRVGRERGQGCEVPV